MEHHALLLFSFVFFAGILFWTILSYILKIWPFTRKKPEKPEKPEKDVTKQSQMSSYESSSSSQSSTPVSPFIGISLFILFMVFIIFIMFISFKTSMARYKIAGDAVKQGNSGVAAAALAPEIGQGIGIGLGSIFKK